ncbi:MAG: ABC transporter ATP-binding protein [Phycisphaerae bacterium]|nr:ABC transporter ATP-binding protein [Phycisphaerae bacterium]
MIRLRDVHKTFDTTSVLRGVDLDVHAGQTTVVIGPSGCGKSVLLKHMAGLIRPDSGTVQFAGRPISAMKGRELAVLRRRMGFLFQGAALFDSLTVGANVCFPLIEHEVGTAEERRRRCQHVLALVGLDGFQDRWPEDLSGGEKKRVALARAIAIGPDVIFYDEPTTGLDPIRADLINELILRLKAALDATAVVVTHDLHSARRVGDRVLMLYNGHFIADTSAEKLDRVDNEVVARFVQGRASPDELARIETGPLGRMSPAGQESG